MFSTRSEGPGSRLSDIKLVITTAPDGRSRLALTTRRRWIERTIYVDLSADQAEQVAMNLLSRALGKP